MQVAVSTWGDGIGVQLPAEVLEELDLTMGDRLELTVKSGRLVLEPVPPVVALEPSSHAGENPMRPLPAIELSNLLGVSEVEVREREARGRLFSIVIANRGTDNLYPTFQAWPEISGRPLETVLNELNVKKHGGGAAYAFFMARDNNLGLLTPVEILIGSVTSIRTLETWVVEVLGRPPGERLELVLEAVRRHLTIVES